MAKQLSGKLVFIDEGEIDFTRKCALEFAELGANCLIYTQQVDLTDLKLEVERLSVDCHVIYDNHDLSMNHCDIIVTPLVQRSFKDPSKTICLNMIVKNEAHVIERCLNNVKPLIDSWIIVDTGSTDGTQDVIRNCLKDIPGELFERKWVDFATNRNEAFTLAKGKADYILFADADDYLLYSSHFKLPKLEKDFYEIEAVFDTLHYIRRFLVKDALDWKWEGILHETIQSPQAKTGEKLIGIIDTYTQEGTRSKDPDKIANDIELLEKIVQEDPNNARIIFYLGMYEKSHGNLPKALQYYEQRIVMGGVKGEVYHSLVEVASIYALLNKEISLVEESYQKAIAFSPSTPDAYYGLITFFRERQNFSKVYSIALAYLKNDERPIIFFNRPSIGDYVILMEFIFAAHMQQHFLECVLAAELLLTKSGVDPEVRKLAQAFLMDSKDKLGVLI